MFIDETPHTSAPLPPTHAGGRIGSEIDSVSSSGGAKNRAAPARSKQGGPILSGLRHRQRSVVENLPMGILLRRRKLKQPVYARVGELAVKPSLELLLLNLCRIRGIQFAFSFLVNQNDMIAKGAFH